MKKALICAVLILSLVSIASCGNSELIIGTWKAQTSVIGDTVETTFVFNEDGTGSMGIAPDISVPMTYKLSRGTLAVTTSVFGLKNTIKYSVSFDGDNMTLTNLADANEVLSFVKAE